MLSEIYSFYFIEIPPSLTDIYGMKLTGRTKIITFGMGKSGMPDCTTILENLILLKRSVPKNMLV